MLAKIHFIYHEIIKFILKRFDGSEMNYEWSTTNEMLDYAKYMEKNFLSIIMQISKFSTNFFSPRQRNIALELWNNCLCQF
jgi:hypothetical protein